jgi:hypothetical protein
MFVNSHLLLSFLKNPLTPPSFFGLALSAFELNFIPLSTASLASSAVASAPRGDVVAARLFL